MGPAPARKPVLLSGKGLFGNCSRSFKRVADRFQRVHVVWQTGRLCAFLETTQATMNQSQAAAIDLKAVRLEKNAEAGACRTEEVKEERLRARELN